MSKVVVHHLAFSRSDRILWLLEELNVPYELKVHTRGKSGFADSITVSPLGKVPILEADGRVITESGAIINHLLTTYAKPGSGLENPPSRDSIFWSHFSEGTLMVNMQAALVSFAGARNIMGGLDGPKPSEEETKGITRHNEWMQAHAQKNVNKALAEVEEFLGKNEWFSGSKDIGEGDFMMSWVLNFIAYAGRRRVYQIGPKTVAWVDRMRSRPAYKRAMDRVKQTMNAQAKL